MSKGSYERISYALRPAKNIERKMIAEVLKRLVFFEPIESYRYVGFGSTTFSDFALFHRVLGLDDMVSIEKDKGRETRFRLNVPFGCIDIKFDTSSAVLPELDWKRKSIVWLDYDGYLDESTLTDVQTFCAKAAPGSVLLLSMNVQFTEEDKPAERLRDQIGEERVPSQIKDSDLYKWKGASLCRKILFDEIRRQLNIRNGGLDEKCKLSYRQLFNFHYSDGARMLTTGGMICEAQAEALYEKCGFEHLDFVRGEEEPLLIDVPILTNRERRYFDARLPGTATKTLSEGSGVREGDIEKYRKIYRFFPNFSETDVV